MNGVIERLHALQAQDSFYAFRQFMNPNMKTGWFVREVSHALQQFVEDYVNHKRPKLVIMAPPQHGKSVAVIEMIAWAIGHYPDTKFIYASFSERLGVRANTKLQRILSSSRYNKVFPDVKLGEKTTQEYFDIAVKNGVGFDVSDGYFRNTTIRGAVTGESLDIGVIDDPLKGRLEANRDTVRNAVWDWFTDDFSSRFSDEGALLIILTRWHVDDPVGRLLAIEDDVKVMRFQAIAENDEMFRKAGEALFPEHKSLDFLKTIKSRMTESSWQSLYQQNPIVMDGEIFKPDKIQIVDKIPLSIVKTVRGWDLAGTFDGDYTAGVKIALMEDGNYIILDVIRIRTTPERVREIIRNTAAQDGKDCKITLPKEPGQAGKAQIRSLVRMLSGYSVVDVPVSGGKIVRADAFSSQVNIGNVFMLRGSFNAEYIDELRMFPNGKYDDQIDASSDSFNELSEFKTDTYNPVELSWL